MSKKLIAPLKNQKILILFSIKFFSNIGLFTYFTGTIWLVKQYNNSSNFEVGLVQFLSFSFPLFLFGIISGILIDFFDRQRYLFFSNLYLSLIALSFGIVIFFRFHTLYFILGFCFLMGIGNALTLPAWQAIMATLVPRKKIKDLTILNGLNSNFGRVIGPVAGGLLLTVSITSIYLLNAFSYLLLALVFLWYSLKENGQKEIKKKQNLKSVINWNTIIVLPLKKIKDLKFLLIITFLTFFIHSYNTLLPIFILETISSDQILFGNLMALFGIGTIISGFILPNLIRYFKNYKILSFAGLIASIAIFIFIFAHNLWAIRIAIILCGISFTTIISGLNVIALYIIPNKFRGRAIALYFSAMHAGASLGALFISYVVKNFGIPVSLWVAFISLLGFTVIRASSKSPKKTK